MFPLNVQPVYLLTLNIGLFYSKFSSFHKNWHNSSSIDLGTTGFVTHRVCVCRTVGGEHGAQEKMNEALGNSLQYSCLAHRWPNTGMVSQKARGGSGGKDWPGFIYLPIQHVFRESPAQGMTLCWALYDKILTSGFALNCRSDHACHLPTLNPAPLL